MLSASRARPALCALVAVAFVALAGCAAAPARERNDGPLAGDDLSQLGEGTIYLVAGPRPERSELWRLDLASGASTRLVPSSSGLGLTSVSASPAGLVLGGETAGVVTAVRYDGHGVAALGGGGVGHPAVAGKGRVAWLRPADTGTPGGNRSAQVEVGALDESRPTVIFRAKHTELSGAGWGPRAWLAVGAREHGATEVLVFDRRGLLRGRLDPHVRGARGAVWGPHAPGVAVTGTQDSEVLGLDGSRQAIPDGWRPLCWRPDAKAMLVGRGTAVGLWKGQAEVVAIPVRLGEVSSCSWQEQPVPDA